MTQHGSEDAQGAQVTNTNTKTKTNTNINTKTKMHEAYHSHLLLKLPLQVESITSAGDQVCISTGCVCMQHRAEYDFEQERHTVNRNDLVRQLPMYKVGLTDTNQPIEDVCGHHIHHIWLMVNCINLYALCTVQDLTKRGTHNY